MQPAISNFFSLKLSAHSFLADTSRPQTFVAVAELVRISGIVIVVVSSKLAIESVPIAIVPKPVPSSGSLMPQSWRLGHGQLQVAQGSQ